MPRVAFSFDLDTVAMRSDSVSEADKTKIYQKEGPTALASLGFTNSPEGSLYITGVMTGSEIMMLSMDFDRRMRKMAPNFCKYVRSAHLMQVDDSSANITSRLNGTVNFD